MSAARTICPWLLPPLRQLERAAVAGRLGHGWMFVGPRGVGKLNLASVLARRILTREVGSADPAVATPASVLADYASPTLLNELHPDLHRVAPEEGKQTISVEQIRDLLSDLGLTPLAGGSKIVVIEQADRMTNAAANALLKSLEEPTRDTYLLLLAELPGRLPATIRSRCQRLTLRPPAADVTRHWLAGGDQVTDVVLAGLPDKPPIVLAALTEDPVKYKNYNTVRDDINLISKASADPHAVADRWAKQDPEQALSCLIDVLYATIRHALVPGHTNRITDGATLIMDNCLRNSSIGALFRQLRTAENLLEQIGRGTNIELALKALLLGLVVTDNERLKA